MFMNQEILRLVYGRLQFRLKLLLPIFYFFLMWNQQSKLCQHVLTPRRHACGPDTDVPLRHLLLLSISVFQSKHVCSIFLSFFVSSIFLFTQLDLFGYRLRAFVTYVALFARPFQFVHVKDFYFKIHFRCSRKQQLFFALTFLTRKNRIRMVTIKRFERALKHQVLFV